MERIVYLTGAGFSAPLGLPLIDNFYMKSQEQYEADRIKFGYFKDIYVQIRALSSTKNIYKSDLYNIEEVLSILEMGSSLELEQLRDFFPKHVKRYIRDVIQYYTPPIQRYSGTRLPGNWERFIFGKDNTHTTFAYFTANLMNLYVEEKQSSRNIPDNERFELRIKREQLHKSSPF